MVMDESKSIGRTFLTPQNKTSEQHIATIMDNELEKIQL
jgi:hypothetical protein